MKKPIFVILVLFLFFSCTRKTTTITEITDNEQQESIENEIVVKPVSSTISYNINSLFPPVEYEPVPEGIVNLLLTTEKDYLNNGRLIELLSVHRGNFGIPGGDNYIALWKNRKVGTYQTNSIYVYSISDEIEAGYRVPTALQINFDASIMNNIPGIHIENMATSFFDINGDGIDEIFSFDIAGMGRFVGICGYDDEKKDIVNYCDIIPLPYELKGPGGIASVVFMSYKGMLGFKAFSFKGNNFPSKWFFYTWDTEKRKYVEVEEVVE